MSGVNQPVDPRVKEQDINNKLRLYGIYAAFAQGKVPSNEQIDITLNSFLASKALSSPSSKLSAEGKVLIKDVRDAIEEAKNLFLSKNDGDLLQDFIWQCQQITGSNAALPSAPTDKATAQEHGNQALQGLRTLGTLILSNGQFRKLLSDATVLFRDMAGDVASNAAGKINPSEDRLRSIDEPAADNTWHDVPSVDHLKSQAKDAYGKNKPFSREDVKAEANNQSTGVNSSAGAQQGASNAVQNLKEKAKSNVDDETQQNVKDTAESARLQTKDYLSKKMPEERREQTIWRLKKMIVEIQNHPDYNEAIDTLLNLAETYGGHAKNVGGQSAGTVKDAHSDDALRNAEADLLALVERFANSTSTDDLWESINNVYKDAQQDPELRKWFSEMNQYVRRLLKETGYILEDSSNQDGNRLYDQGQFLLRERYRDHTNRVLDEVKFLADQFEKDPQNQRFGKAMDKLFQHLGNDENGKPTFKPDLLKDLATIIVPGAFERVRYIPIPRIEVSDPQFDAIVENLVIEGDNLMPNGVELTSDNNWKWGRKGFASSRKNKFELAVSGIQMDLRDVSYYVKRKQGFPSITDKGIFDLFFGGTGFSFKAGLETPDSKDRQHFFKVSSLKVDLKNLKIKLKKSNHKLLFNIFKPTLMGILKPVILKVIEKQIKDTIEKGDAYAWDIKKEADRALEDAKNNPDPDNIQNIYQRYLNAIQARAAEGKRKADKAQERAKQTQANVAITKNDSIFKNISLPGGISTKATEYQEMAKKGDKWQSPVFALGSASKSNNIPKAAPITRKPHSVTQGQVRSGSAANTTGTGNYGSTGAGNYGSTGAGNYGSTGAGNYGSTGAGNYGSTGAGNYGSTGAGNYGSTGSNFDSNLNQSYNNASYMGNGNGIKTSTNDAPVLTGQTYQ